jgi:hypothetical protein
MPMTSLACTSRHARTHRLQLMHASRLTAMAECVLSATGRSPLGKRRVGVTPMASTQFQKLDFGSWLPSRSG